MLFFSGTSNQPLAQKIADKVRRPLENVVLERFPDSEIKFELIDSARSQHTIIFQSIIGTIDDKTGEKLSVNDILAETIAMTDAIKTNGGKSVTLCAPYLGYSRQDRRANDKRVPIMAKAIAKTLHATGVDQILTADVHNPTTGGFYDTFTSIPTAELFTDDVKQNYELGNTVVASPDSGGLGRARMVAKLLNRPVVFVDKRRSAINDEIEEMYLIGAVKGKHVILVDDIGDSCGTVLKCVNLLHNNGAKSVRAYISHGIFSKNALERLAESPLLEMVVTDSIKNIEADKNPKIRRISIAPALLATIHRCSLER